MVLIEKPFCRCLVICCEPEPAIHKADLADGYFPVIGIEARGVYQVGKAGILLSFRVARRVFIDSDKQAFEFNVIDINRLFFHVQFPGVQLHISHIKIQVFAPPGIIHVKPHICQCDLLKIK